MASVEQAETLLREWNISAAQIFCTSVSLGRASSLRGVVVEADREGFTIADSSGENLAVRFFQVWKVQIDIVKFFRISKLKIENPVKGSVVSALRLALDDGGEITLIEEGRDKK